MIIFIQAVKMIPQAENWKIIKFNCAYISDPSFTIKNCKTDFQLSFLQLDQNYRKCIHITNLCANSCL